MPKADAWAMTRLSLHGAALWPWGIGKVKAEQGNGVGQGLQAARVQLIKVHRLQGPLYGRAVICCRIHELCHKILAHHAPLQCERDT